MRAAADLRGRTRRHGALLCAECDAAIAHPSGQVLTFARNTQPITVAIFTKLRQFGANIDVIAPASFLSLIVPLAVFFAFQRYFVQWLLAGSVK